MIVVGVMSGTSADGIDVAFVRVGKSRSRKETRVGGRGRAPQTEDPAAGFEFLGHAAFPYPAPVRRTVLATMNSVRASVADMAKLNFLLGELYADAVLAAQERLKIRPELVGCHGQTIYHQGQPALFLGRQQAVTWQIGEGAVLAARVGVPVVSDFRPSDMAVGGKGAPLVPYFDYLLYRNPQIGRVALNIGGIANVTAIPAGAAASDVLAFDTGPGNMVIDALTQQLFGKSYDRDGQIAATGRVLDAVVSGFLRTRFFARKPPKTAGREEFGREFAREFLRACKNAHKSRRGLAVQNADFVATATAFTARCIAHAIERYVFPKGRFSELIASGGGTCNRTLMAGLANESRALRLRLRSSEEFGVPAEAKEAVAFAVLAFETWNRRPSNLPSATGANRPAVLGKVSYP